MAVEFVDNHPKWGTRSDGADSLYHTQLLLKSVRGSTSQSYVQDENGGMEGCPWDFHMAILAPPTTSHCLAVVFIESPLHPPSAQTTYVSLDPEHVSADRLLD